MKVKPTTWVPHPHEVRVGGSGNSPRLVLHAQRSSVAILGEVLPFVRRTLTLAFLLLTLSPTLACKPTSAPTPPPP